MRNALRACALIVLTCGFTTNLSGQTNDEDQVSSKNETVDELDHDTWAYGFTLATSTAAGFALPGSIIMMWWGAPLNLENATTVLKLYSLGMLPSAIYIHHPSAPRILRQMKDRPGILRKHPLIRDGILGFAAGGLCVSALALVAHLL